MRLRLGEKRGILVGSPFLFFSFGRGAGVHRFEKEEREDKGSFSFSRGIGQ